MRIALVFLLFAGLPVYAEERDTLSRWGGSVSIQPTTVVGLDHYVRMWLKRKRSFSLEGQLLHVSLPADSDAYAADYGYPTLSLGIKYAVNRVTMHREENQEWGLLEPVDYESRLGNILSVYGSFARPFFRTRHWEVDYTLSFGLAYAHRKYALGDNADDEFIGSRWLIYFGAGLHATCRIAQNWGLKAGVEFFHHSNGALNRPNKGANYLGPSLALVYYPYYEKLLDNKIRYSPCFRKYWYMNLTLGMGAKTLDEDWQRTQFQTSPREPDYRRSRFHVYTAYSVRADLMYRHARRWASGVGADLFYGTYSRHIAEMDAAAGVRHSPWSFGLSAKHAVFYHNLSLDMSLGYYLYREMGTGAKALEKPYYEHIGLHYTLRALRNLTVGINIKAHLTKADLTELVVSYPVKL